MRKTVILLVSFFYLTSVYSQTNPTVAKDTVMENLVAKYRQVFWDNLPHRSGWINDYENLYTKKEEHQLDSLIHFFEKKTTIEIAVVTIDTIKTSKENFDNLSLHMAQQWNLGKQDFQNGILIAISRGHRKMRIQNGNGIELLISDEETKAIIDTYFIPYFKKEDYYNGTFVGLKELMKLLETKIK
ncbi:hypothetical protein D3C85_193470 [compost metagenome]